MSQPLIVPIQLVTGSLHFAELKSADPTVQDTVDYLKSVEEVRSDVLGDVPGELEDTEWGLQRIREERSGRPWEEDELVGLGDGSFLLLMFKLSPSSPRAYPLF